MYIIFHIDYIPLIIVNPVYAEPGSDTYASTSEGYQGGSFESDRQGPAGDFTS